MSIADIVIICILAAAVAAAAEAGKKLIKFKIYIKKQEETKC